MYVARFPEEEVSIERVPNSSVQCNMVGIEEGDTIL